MDGVAAEIAKEVVVFFKDDDVDACAEWDPLPLLNTVGLPDPWERRPTTLIIRKIERR